MSPRAAMPMWFDRPQGVPTPRRAWSPSRLVTVASLMSRPLITIAPDAELWQARESMTEHGVHHLLVEDRSRIVGLISDRDIAHRLHAPTRRDVTSRQEDEAQHRKVLQAATFRLVTISADATIEEAAALLLERAISALPVVDDAGEVVGILTSHHLLRGLVACALPSA